MSLSHDEPATTSAVLPNGKRLSDLLDDSYDQNSVLPPVYAANAGGSSHSALVKPEEAPTPAAEQASPVQRQHQLQSHASPRRQSLADYTADAYPQHMRSSRNSSASPTHNQTPPFNSYHRTNTGGTTPGRRQPSHPLPHHSPSNASSTPPRIRQTRSEIHRSHDGSASQALTPAHDESKISGYQLWLPWEETALVDWLFEPINCKLFNEPRRKKECHERIIREILPSKTSRAIEGKIRTLEKRYQKAAAEIQREDFARTHPEKCPEEVAEALCNNFYKLETIFNPTNNQPRNSHSPSAQPQQKKRQLPWINRSTLQPNTGAASHPDTTAGSSSSSQMHAILGYDHASRSSPLTSAPNAGSKGGKASGNGGGSSSNAGSTLSVPRSPPPRITTAESLPLPYRMLAHGRKIAPKRGVDGGSPVDAADMNGDAPVMMGQNKRSRTFPSMLQNRRSPGYHHHLQQQQQQQQHQNQLQQKQQQQQHQQQQQQPQQKPLHPPAMDLRNANNPQIQQQLQQQQQQQQRAFENGIRYSYDISATGRPATATLPLMPIASPMGGHAVHQPVSASIATQQQHYQQPLTPSAPNASLRDTYEHGHIRSVSNSAILGTREELEWLQFNLRREELEFRKTVFAQEQDIEAKRVRLEERKLDVQKRELELENRRIEMQQQQMDLQMETMKSMSVMLNQMAKQMSGLLGTALGSDKEAASSKAVDSESK
ncbi:hypothetical protein BX070DRAFT_133474 [Coemansia spiralis]|nr:hypothetical protein BX070DRAFT_133474 [Coemansia spiralis]